MAAVVGVRGEKDQDIRSDPGQARVIDVVEPLRDRFDSLQHDRLIRHPELDAVPAAGHDQEGPAGAGLDPQHEVDLAVMQDRPRIEDGGRVDQVGRHGGDVAAGQDRVRRRARQHLRTLLPGASR
ncbi:MAG: hypothetical protein V2A76_07300 [Planctomycetota bacterium]